MLRSDITPGPGLPIFNHVDQDGEIGINDSFRHGDTYVRRLLRSLCDLFVEVRNRGNCLSGLGIKLDRFIHCPLITHLLNIFNIIGVCIDKCLQHPQFRMLQKWLGRYALSGI